MDRVGRQGVVSMEESRTAEDNLYVVEGMQFERGYISPYFVTDPERMVSLLALPLTKKIKQDPPLHNAPVPRWMKLDCTAQQPHDECEYCAFWKTCRKLTQPVEEALYQSKLCRCTR